MIFRDPFFSKVEKASTNLGRWRGILMVVGLLATWRGIGGTFEGRKNGI